MILQWGSGLSCTWDLAKLVDFGRSWLIFVNFQGFWPFYELRGPIPIIFGYVGVQRWFFRKIFFVVFLWWPAGPLKTFFFGRQTGFWSFFRFFPRLPKKSRLQMVPPDRKSQNRSSVRWIYVWVGYIPKISSIGALTGSPAYTARSWLIFLAPKPVFLMFY